MLFPVALIHGVDRSKTLAESALPHAPTIGESEMREVRPRLARARETILRSS
jgi:hypothetical protein